MEAAIDSRRIFGELAQLREMVFSIAQKVDRLLAERDKTAPNHPYIIRDVNMHNGEPTIKGTALTVRTIVERTKLGDSVDDIVEAYPVLTPAKVHAALGYYYDHKAEIDRYIRENEEMLWRTPRPLYS